MRCFLSIAQNLVKKPSRYPKPDPKAPPQQPTAAVDASRGEPAASNQLTAIGTRKWQLPGVYPAASASSSASSSSSSSQSASGGSSSRPATASVSARPIHSSSGHSSARQWQATDAQPPPSDNEKTRTCSHTHTTHLPSALCRVLNIAGVCHVLCTAPPNSEPNSEPQLRLSFAAGLGYGRRHAWFNSYLNFPNANFGRLSEEELRPKTPEPTTLDPFAAGLGYGPKHPTFLAYQHSSAKHARPPK